MTETLWVVLGVVFLVLVALVVLASVCWVIFLIGGAWFSGTPADQIRLRRVLLVGALQIIAYIIVLYLLVKFVKWSWYA